MATNSTSKNLSSNAFVTMLDDDMFFQPVFSQEIDVDRIVDGTSTNPDVENGDSEIDIMPIDTGEITDEEVDDIDNDLDMELLSISDIQDIVTDMATQAEADAVESATDAYDIEATTGMEADFNNGFQPTDISTEQIFAEPADNTDIGTDSSAADIPENAVAPTIEDADIPIAGTEDIPKAALESYNTDEAKITDDTPVEYSSELYDIETPLVEFDTPTYDDLDIDFNNTSDSLNISDFFEVTIPEIVGASYDDMGIAINSDVETPQQDNITAANIETEQNNDLDATDNSLSDISLDDMSNDFATDNMDDIDFQNDWDDDIG